VKLFTRRATGIAGATEVVGGIWKFYSCRS